MDHRLHTPEGVKDYLPREYAVKKNIQDNIEKVFAGFDYSFVESPTFEYIQVYEGKGSADPKTMYKFVDRDGSILALRPDVTPAIGRIAATVYSKEDIPLRLAYVGNVFRYNEHYQGKFREFSQAGIELIGADSVQADGEVLTVAIESLLAAGLEDFKIDIGNVMFLQGVLEEAGLSKDICEDIREGIISKNYVKVSRIAESVNINGKLKELLCTLPLLSGDITVAEKVKKLVNNQKSLKAAEHLENIYKILAFNGLEKYISFDFGVIGHFDYYTGLVFRGYAKGTGFSVVDGGRYDRLIEQYPAVGFAIKIMDIMTALENTGKIFEDKKEKIYVSYDENNYENACKLSLKLRKTKDIPVRSGLSPCTLAQAEEYARNNNIDVLYHFEGDKLYYIKSGEHKLITGEEEK